MAFLQENTLIVTTEFGMLEVEPTEICVVQRGIVMQVALKNPGPARGEGAAPVDPTLRPAR